MGLTQKDFADLIQVPQPSVSAYENGKNNPTMNILVNIANKCNISLDWLFGVSSNKHKVSNVGDYVDILFQMLESNEIKVDPETNQIIFTDEHKDVINEIYNELYSDILDSNGKYMNYFYTDEQYELCKDNLKEKYSDHTLTKKVRSEVIYEEIFEAQKRYFDALLEKNKKK